MVVELFGSGVSITAQAEGKIKTSLQSRTENTQSVNFNRIMVESMAKGLDADKATGILNNEKGVCDSLLYYQATRDRYSTSETTLKAQCDKIQVPGDTLLNTVDQVKTLRDQAMDATTDKFGDIGKVIKK